MVISRFASANPTPGALPPPVPTPASQPPTDLYVPSQSPEERSLRPLIGTLAGLGGGFLISYAFAGPTFSAISLGSTLGIAGAAAGCVGGYKLGGRNGLLAAGSLGCLAGAVGGSLLGASMPAFSAVLASVAAGRMLGQVMAMPLPEEEPASKGSVTPDPSQPK